MRSQYHFENYCLFLFCYSYVQTAMKTKNQTYIAKESVTDRGKVGKCKFTNVPKRKNRQTCSANHVLNL